MHLNEEFKDTLTDDIKQKVSEILELANEVFISAKEIKNTQIYKMDLLSDTLESYSLRLKSRVKDLADLIEGKE